MQGEIETTGATAQRGELIAYLDPPPEPPLAAASTTKRLLRRFVPTGARPLVAQAATDVFRGRERRRARRLLGTPLRLHFGSAASRKAGWVNIDLVGHDADLVWNLRRPLPFPAGSADAVFHEHVLEHFSLDDGLRLLDECFRVLRPGGVLRVGVPDARAYAESYLAGGHGLIEAEQPGRPTPMLALEEVFYRHGHKAMYDRETLTLFMSAAGFTGVAERPLGESAISPAPDSVHRRPGTIYVEGTR